MNNHFSSMIRTILFFAIVLNTCLVSAQQISNISVDAPAVLGELTTNNPVNRFQFQVITTSEYVIETLQESDSSVDTIITLLGPGSNEVELASNDDGGSGLFSRIQIELQPGIYFVDVVGYENSTGMYRIQVVENSQINPENPPSPPQITATPIPSQNVVELQVNSSPRDAELSSVQDFHWYRFQTGNEGVYEIETFPVSGSNIDTFILLYGPGNSQRIITQDDDSGESLFYSKITITLEANETYFVEVYELFSDTGSYSIQVRSSSVIPPTFTPTNTPTFTRTPTPTFTPLPTNTPTPFPTHTPTITPTPRIIPTPQINVIPNTIHFSSADIGQNNQPAGKVRISRTQQDYSLQLKTGTIDTSQRNVTKQSLSEDIESDSHMLIQFNDDLTHNDHDGLNKAGIELLQYIPNLAYWASVSKNISPLSNITEGKGIRWAAQSINIDKISPLIRQNNFPTYVLRQNNEVELTIEFFSDVSALEALRIIRTTGITFIRWIDNHTAVVNTPVSSIDQIGNQDSVAWIEWGPAPKGYSNSTASQRIQVNSIRENPYNLSGKDIIVGVWDCGTLFPHRDFGSRFVLRERNTIEENCDHATHVAATVGGAGILNSRARGMAVNSIIHSYDWDDDIVEMDRSIRDGVRLTNHSYGLITGWHWNRAKNDWEDFGNSENFGAYSSVSRGFDSIVNRTNLLVFIAAGNDRGEGPGGRRIDGPYDCIEGSGVAKNVITIGATRDDDTMSSFSCWGPTDDGRVKPDLCANGVSVFSALPFNSYASWDGTSMATPGACGAATLLFELFKNQYDVEPAPETLKAILIHTASDQGRPGPDYEYGWGVINSKDAADVIIEENWREDTVSQGETVQFEINVPSGAQELKTTIAWTDPPASTAAVLSLVNNLDLIARSPSGVVHQPWVLNRNRPEQNATTGNNFVDNVEQVLVENPQPGTWVIEVSGTGVRMGSQGFTLVSELLGGNPERGKVSKQFSIINNGEVDLQVTSMSVANTDWIALDPQAPLTIAPGQQEKVQVIIDFNLAPEGETQRQVRILSNDLSNSPYRDGVQLIINKTPRPPTPTPTSTPTATPTPLPGGILLQTDGSAFGGEISVGNEVDQYQFQVNRTGRYEIFTQSSSLGETVDTVIQLLGPNDENNFIAENDDGGIGLFSRIVANLQANQRYFVKVRGFDSSSIGFYEIVVKEEGN